jgi:hypothetical protein
MDLAQSAGPKARAQYRYLAKFYLSLADAEESRTAQTSFSTPLN